MKKPIWQTLPFQFLLVLSLMMILSPTISIILNNSANRTNDRNVPELASLPTIKNKIYLTIDMDMTKGMRRTAISTGQKWYDPKIFEYLKSEKVPVTFFISGLFAEHYPDVMKNLVAENMHSFQNHGYDEMAFTPNCYNLEIIKNEEDKIAQVQMTQKVLQEITGELPTYFRFPGICHSDYDDDLIRKLGLKIDHGTVIAGDPFNKNIEAMIQSVLGGTKEGSVIIMHIGGPNAPHSYDVLTKIVPELRNRGFTFSLLGE